MLLWWLTDVFIFIYHPSFVSHQARERISQLKSLDPELKICGILMAMIKNLHLLTRYRLFRNFE